MDCYVEISLLPDPEFPDSILMNALFAKLHRALAENGKQEIGVSFPEFGKKLNSKLRIHGSEESLKRLMDLNWIQGMKDYTRVSGIAKVPDSCQYRTVKRVQAKSSVDRLYRRSVKKGWLSEENAEQQKERAREGRLKLPFVQLKSQTTGQQFRLFIQHGSLQEKPVTGRFSSYGLSNEATVPWF
ncbi:type I-F CRISPR-associated endoribonuclease Cas6/Csy4 [Desulfurivibrio alkaliphilus]|nr:type I-F CRISPR-associated endoribonuclease Cas6/Csy4 [Desulfurivibrio alkaliphilus]